LAERKNIVGDEKWSTNSLTQLFLYNTQTMKKRAFVGMSGGVDSSVSAALLKERGFDVTGVFIKVWEPPFLHCTATEDRLDAMRVCATLGIPFTTLDLEAEYKREVVDYMVAAYKAGQTPNPDVMCNQHIKFGAFYNWARAQGADIVATGHYAQVLRQDDNSELHMGIDQNKDQSYFLWTLAGEQLDHIEFPVGSITKPEVRQLADKFGLHTASKKDSQGLCFIGKLDMKEFLREFINENPGDVLNEKGEVIGSHPGALFFTLGERHGFSVTTSTPNDKPRYVIAKDTDRNTITVSDSPHEFSEVRHVVLERCNWITQPPVVGQEYQARLRYRQALFVCCLDEIEGDRAVISLPKPQPFVPAGQSFVLYDDSRCVGGGIIS
jgi:tRNA-specific 2-thiouridylase